MCVCVCVCVCVLVYAENLYFVLCKSLLLHSQVDVDPANVEAGIKEALLKARESEAIAKYLGTSESKIRAGDHRLTADDVEADLVIRAAPEHSNRTLRARFAVGDQSL